MAHPKARIKPELLEWARTTAGMTPTEAVGKLGLELTKLQAWESGTDAPSIPQLRKLANLYKRPLAVFYLQEVPVGFMVLRDLRRLPGMGLRRLPSSVMLETRRASQRRALALELLEDVGEVPRRFELGAQVNERADDVGARVRQALQVSIEDQVRNREATGRASYRLWRERIEQYGVLVFQAMRMDGDEASGFAIYADLLPVIVVNRADPPTRRTFSLLHEFVHLMIRVSGVSDHHIDDLRPPEDQSIEVFCNAVAAATLIPGDHLLANAVVAGRRRSSEDWTDLEIEELARDYGVSREALIRRLLTCGKTTRAFYLTKREQYVAEFRAQRERQREQSSDEGIPRNMPQETVGNFGRPFVRMVLENYHGDRLSLNEVSAYLGLKTKHIAKLEELARSPVEA